LGVKLLTLYPKARPGELRNVQEGHINLAEQWIVFPDPKEGEPKFIHLVPEDCELIKSLWEPRGLPQMYFFSHLQSRSGIEAGRQFGPKYLKTWWDRACKNLGITGIDPYGGTRHSTVTALGKVLSPEQIQRGATGHASDAFKRYFLPNLNEAHVATRANHDIRTKKTEKIMNLQEKKS
jgi:integrase